MNDVLTTVGLCINVNANVERIRSSMHNDMLSNTERTKIDAVMSENEAGIFVAFTESVFAPLAGICTLGLRQRLQVGASRFR